MLPKQSAPRRVLRRLRWHVRTLAGRDVRPHVELRCATDPCAGCDGGWTICPDGLDANSIVYSFGIGQDITWDRYLIERFGLTVHAFDPTPQSLAWLAEQSLPPQLVVHEYGLADFDGTARFCPPLKHHHVDHTMLARPDTEHRAIEVPVRRLATIARELGHRHIDVLKMDIEGAEYQAIGDIIRSGVAIGQLLIEFHHRFPGVGPERTRAALAELHRAGFRIFAISDSGQEYSLVCQTA